MTAVNPVEGIEPAERVAIVIVTFNRVELLLRCLDGIGALDRVPDAVYVIDNASSDETPSALAERSDPWLRIVRSEDNLGGAGGFSMGLRRAYDDGFDRMWLMDDDVVPSPTSLGELLAHGGPALVAVREDLEGRLVEKAAIRFDLVKPFALNPKRATVDGAYESRAAMPATVTLENVAFEGFMVHRSVVDAVGFPDPSYFIFYDDVDYALRVRAAGFPIVAVRDAVVVRQLAFDQQHAMDSWKGYYMYRNFFVVHFRYGANPLVRLRPYVLAAGVFVLSPWRGGKAERRNVVRGLLDARRFDRSR